MLIDHQVCHIQHSLCRQFMSSFKKIERRSSNSTVAHFKHRLAISRDLSGPAMGRLRTE